ncbi:uncharacterized protein [Physeter macrocephalus]|uniref:Uncharacterized protein isoform X2 n=1 Tax=Physeter macrocephalus TaxID=9755 RepID=A0A455B3G7_PHYMC|nr:uncharacterized protein LOC114485429 isoform X2 [Physeter catodon]|eukprot:XP_028342623.1 uncharacterized protein LOC114485429 isoform X2 [Physeter catodon]
MVEPSGPALRDVFLQKDGSTALAACGQRRPDSRRLPGAGGASAPPASRLPPCLSLGTSTWPVCASLCLLAPPLQRFAAPSPSRAGSAHLGGALSSPHPAGVAHQTAAGPLKIFSEGRRSRWGGALKPETLLFCLTHPPTQSHNKDPRSLPPGHKTSPSSSGLLSSAVWWGHCEDDSPRAGSSDVSPEQDSSCEGGDLSHAPVSWGVCKVPLGTPCAWSVPGQAGRGSLLCQVPGKAWQAAQSWAPGPSKVELGEGSQAAEVPHLGLNPCFPGITGTFFSQN